MGRRSKARGITAAPLTVPGTQAPAAGTEGQCSSNSVWHCWNRSELQEAKELNSRWRVLFLLLQDATSRSQMFKMHVVLAIFDGQAISCGCCCGSNWLRNHWHATKKTVAGAAPVTRAAATL